MFVQLSHVLFQDSSYVGEKRCQLIFVIDGWMTCDFYVLFDSVSVMSGQWEVDNERLCAMELRLRLRRSRTRSAISVGTRLTH